MNPTFSLQGEIPEGGKIGFYLWKPNIPRMCAKWVRWELGRKHALSIYGPKIFNAIFTFGLRTKHVEV
ncbi:MAG: hypothetical protein PHY74_07365 [Candidatus Bathyarchaeota archaeon]|nr:hypothetical protein [Candidatus Bathyarchaeota archaeon]MDI9578124.1 hypothetical protein [Thermoproteota archaeon]NLD65174.1 hypothetical protein [Thermoproteota archaeon]